MISRVLCGACGDLRIWGGVDREGQLAFWEQEPQMLNVLWHIGPPCAVKNCPMVLECPGGHEGETCM